MSEDTNPLLHSDDRIPFHLIEAEHVGPAVEAALDDARAVVEEVAGDDATPEWSTTLGRLDGALERLSEIVSPVGHLVSAAETPVT